MSSSLSTSSALLPQENRGDPPKNQKKWKKRVKKIKKLFKRKDGRGSRRSISSSDNNDNNKSLKKRGRKPRNRFPKVVGSDTGINDIAAADELDVVVNFDSETTLSFFPGETANMDDSITATRSDDYDTEESFLLSDLEVETTTVAEEEEEVVEEALLLFPASQQVVVVEEVKKKEESTSHDITVLEEALLLVPKSPQVEAEGIKEESTFDITDLLEEQQSEIRTMQGMGYVYENIVSELELENKDLDQKIELIRAKCIDIKYVLADSKNNEEVMQFLRDDAIFHRTKRVKEQEKKILAARANIRKLENEIGISSE